MGTEAQGSSHDLDCYFSPGHLAELSQCSDLDFVGCWIPAAFLFPTLIFFFASLHISTLFSSLQSFPHACDALVQYVFPVAELGRGSLQPSQLPLTLPSTHPAPLILKSTTARGKGYLPDTRLLTVHLAPPAHSGDSGGGQKEAHWGSCRNAVRTQGRGRHLKERGREGDDIQGRLEKERAIC